MGLGVLIIGKSGAGKSSSLRNFVPGEVGIVNVLNKPLPFRSDLKAVQMTDYQQIEGLIAAAKAKSIVIDDAGYLITNMFMDRHALTGKGNAVFDLYNDLADRFYHLVRFVDSVDPDKIVYFMMHEDKNDFGDIAPKTIGKLLSEKVDVAGLFTICLRCMVEDGKHVFKTQSSGFDVAKSPMGMFADTTIDNDLKLVDDTIREYYGIQADPAAEAEPTKKSNKSEKVEDK